MESRKTRQKKIYPGKQDSVKNVFCQFFGRIAEGCENKTGVANKTEGLNMRVRVRVHILPCLVCLFVLF